jgi:hypothetical protein
MAIVRDVGDAAADYNDFFSGEITVFNVGNPLNADGRIDTVQVYAKSDITGFKVGLFYDDGSPSYACRSYASIGAVTAGAVRTFAVVLLGLTGDFIGCYIDNVAGEIEANNADGAGVWYIGGGDYCVDDGGHVYTNLANFKLALYGTGSTSPYAGGIAGKLISAGCI